MKVDYIHQTKIDSKLREKIDYGRKIGKKWIVFITLLLFSMQMAWAQSLTKEDLTKTEICDFKAGTISYTIPSEKISEGTVCTWTVKVDDKETSEGVKVSGEEEKRNKLTLNLSQKTRSVEVSYTDAESKQQTISFVVEPKVYGNTYNGKSFYAEEEKFAGEGSKEKPYIISSDLELAKLAHDVTNGNSQTMYSGKYFQLSKDINLNKGIWMPIGTLNTDNAGFFGGILDGDGKTISNMKIYWTTNGSAEAS